MMIFPVEITHPAIQFGMIVGSLTAVKNSEVTAMSLSQKSHHLKKLRLLIGVYKGENFELHGKRDFYK